MWLTTESANAEQMLQRDIMRALNEQIEKILLGDAAASATQPAGIGNLVTSAVIADWSDTIALE
jgi:hypothetical protein